MDVIIVHLSTIIHPILINLAYIDYTALILAIINLITEPPVIQSPPTSLGAAIEYRNDYPNRNGKRNDRPVDRIYIKVRAQLAVRLLKPLCCTEDGHFLKISRL